MPKAALITNLCLERLLRFTVKRINRYSLLRESVGFTDVN